MALARQSDDIIDVITVELTRHGDERGAFTETYRAEWLPGARPMLQGNLSTKRAGALVGLHHHLHQADYWYAVSGDVWVVLHDLRAGSPTEGITASFTLTGLGLYIPPGVGHGFAARTDCTLAYLVDAYYDPADELGVTWDDPDVAADWKVADPVLSSRDRANPRRADLPAEHRPRWSPS